MRYLPRIVDGELTDRLAASGAVVIEGPKAAGKTATASQAAQSEVRFDTDEEARDALAIAPSLVLEGVQPRLLDEWQVAPSVWNLVRRHIDDSGGSPGQFILTGSSVPSDDINRHTGAGRFSFLRMRPMTLYETGHTNAAVSFSALLAGDRPTSTDPGLTITDIAERIVIGGWPAHFDSSIENAMHFNRDYLRQVRDVEVSQVAGGRRRDPQRIGALLQSLGRNIASEVKRSVLADESSLSAPTVDEYLDILSRLMLVEDQPAWSPSMKSAARLRRAPKRHFVDPSLAVATSDSAGPQALLRELSHMGALFESLAVRDIRVLAQPLGGNIFHYRDSNDLEVDIVVQSDSGWAAFEVKLNPKQVDKGANSLARLRQNINTDLWGEPSCLGVITATGYAYERPDGVMVLPLGTLAP